MLGNAKTMTNSGLTAMFWTSHWQYTSVCHSRGQQQQPHNTYL